MAQEAELDRLCEACQNLFSSDPSVKAEVRSDASFANYEEHDFESGRTIGLEDGEVLVAHLRGGAMIDSAQSGCHLCSLLIASQEPGRTLKQGDQVWMQFKQFKEIWHAQLRMHVVDIEKGTWSAFVGSVRLHRDEFLAYTGERFSHDVADRPSFPSTSSKKTLDRIARWMRTCSEKHNSCNKSNQSRFLPTRVLEITNCGTFRLVNSSSLALDSRYMTLSHCWGPNGVAFTLNHTSLDWLKGGVPIDDLPPTFRDAVQIVKGLGYSYLWIDALCIIQGDESDWRQESSKMADVYLNSELNIAASLGIDSHQGISRNRNPLGISPCIINTSWKNVPSIFASRDDKRPQSIVRGSHLNTRAWVLQERLLAPRVVHFGASEVYWECNFSFCRETFPQQEASYANDADIKRCLAIGGSTNIDSLSDPTNLLNSWRHVVELYTNANLTHPSDKLVAISGLARRFATVSEGALGEYFAGLWEAEFIYQLAWRTSWPDRLPLSCYVAPSWSWASTQKLIYSHQHGMIGVPMIDSTFVHLENVKTSVISDPFGPVTSGHVNLKGTLCKVCLVFGSEEDIDIVIISGSSFAMRMEPWVPEHASIKIDRYPPFPEFVHGEHIECYLLPLFQSHRKYADSKSSPKELVGLALRPTRSKNGQFTRIGLICLRSPEIKEAFKVAISEESIEDRFFEELDERWGYAIEII